MEFHLATIIEDPKLEYCRHGILFTNDDLVQEHTNDITTCLVFIKLWIKIIENELNN